MPKYYYLDISLKFDKNVGYEITAEYFKRNIICSINQLFGEVSACIDVDILKYNSKTGQAILRVPANHYVKIRSSLILCGAYQGDSCTYIIHKASPVLLNLQGPGGKDRVIFATREDHQIPSTVTLPEPEPQPGLILPNGTINWNCPCLGGMATGPCGVEFRNAFSCFHYSEAEPKGSDCYDLFKTMQNCMQQYPTLYNKDLADDDDFTLMDSDKKETTDNISVKESTEKAEKKSS